MDRPVHFPTVAGLAHWAALQWARLSIDLPLVAGQAAFIIVTGIAALLLASRFKRKSSGPRPGSWLAALERMLESVKGTALWLAALWLALVAGRMLGVELHLIDAGVSLLLAWITIRILSFAVRNRFWSGVISATAWSVAALKILGLLQPLSRQMDAMALDLGRFRVSVLTLVQGLFLLALLLWLANLLSDFIERRIRTTDTLNPSLQALLVRLLRLLLPGLAIVTALGAAGINLTALTVFSGALGIGVGLGLQRILANLVAGVTLILGKSIKPGDVIAYKGSYGWVTFMGARYVAIATRDGNEYLVPNEDFITNAIDNWSYSNPNRRLHIPVGVAYESDLHAVIALCLDAAGSVPRVLKHPEPICLVTAFGDSAVELEIRVWINDPQNGIGRVKSAILLAVWDRFAAAGVKIPFPQRDVHIVAEPQRETP